MRDGCITILSDNEAFVTGYTDIVAAESLASDVASNAGLHTSCHVELKAGACLAIIIGDLCILIRDYTDIVK